MGAAANTHLLRNDHCTSGPDPIKILQHKFFSGPIPASFCLFLSFSHYNFNNASLKSVDGVLGIRTSSHRMVGVDETLEPACTL